MSGVLLGKSIDNDPINIDIQKLVESRLLIQANSGAGKSWAIRRILEQTHGKIQHLVLDVEDEFHTLREKYDYILARSRDGDCVAEPRSAGLLVRHLLKHGTSAIMGIYELKVQQRIQFVKNFLESLVNAPRELWRPVLVIVDEAHMFAPQKGEAASTGAVIDLMTRGRKRGFCGILATQRISKLNKDAVAEANNKLIGRAAMDIDMKRAAEELGLSSKDEMRRLRTMKPGHFFAFGPAISDTVTEMRVGGVKTTHPRPGQRTAPVLAPRSAIKKALKQLEDIPKEAEEELRTVAQFKKRIRELEAEARLGKRIAPKVDPKALEHARDQGFAEGKRATINEMKEFRKVIAEMSKANDKGMKHLQAAAISFGMKIDMPKPRIEPVRQKVVVAQRTSMPVGPPVSTRVPDNGSSAEGISGGALRMLKVLAQRHPAKFTKAQWATLAGMSPRGGTFNTYISKLKTTGCVLREGSLFCVTDEGMDAAGEIPPAPTTSAEVIDMWRNALPGRARDMFMVIVEAHPEYMTKEELGEAMGMSPGGGTFNTYLSKIRANGLLEKDGAGFRAAEALFE